VREEWVLGCGGGAWAIAADAGAWLDAERSPENYGPLRQVRCPPGASQVLGFARERERERERERKRERKREREDTHTLTLTHTHTHKERERLGKYRSSQRNDTLQGARFPPASSQYRVRDAARPFSTGGEEGRDYGRFICALAR
jgi:hypothetical protein